MSQYTSFVAVEQKIVNVGGKQRTVDVPVEMPEGVSYEGIFGMEANESRAKGLLMAPYPGRAGGMGGGGFASVPQTAAAASPLSRQVRLRSDRARNETSDLEILSDAGRQKLEQMKPEQRRAALRQAKLSKALRDKLTAGARGKLEIQVWLAELPADGLKKLKDAGFVLSAELRPKKLLLGMITAEKLDALIALDFVRAVEEPRLR